MWFTVTLRVDPGTSDPEKVAGVMDQYLRDMLYVGADTDESDPFGIIDIFIEDWDED